MVATSTERVRKSFGARFFWGLVVASYDVGGAAFFKIRFDDGDVDIFAAPEVLQDIKQAEKHARDDKAAPSASALKLRMAAQTSATSYEDEVKRTALKRKRGEERGVQVTPVNPKDVAQRGVEVTVWSDRLYMSIIAGKRGTKIVEFVKREDGSMGEVEATGKVAVGDVISEINGTPIHELVSPVSELIRTLERPLTIVFRKKGDRSWRSTPTPEQQASEAAAPRESSAQTRTGATVPPAAARSSPSNSPPPPPPSIPSVSVVAAVPSQYRPTQSSTAVGNMHFVQQPPQPAFGASHPSMRATASATQQEYAAAVRANPWDRTYTSTAQLMRSAPVPAYGMQVPMNPQAHLLRHPQALVAAATSHFSQHPATSSFLQYQPNPAGTSMPSYDAQVSAAARGNNYAARQSSSSTLGVRIQLTPSVSRPSGSAQIIDNSYRESSPSSSPPLGQENPSSGARSAGNRKGGARRVPAPNADGTGSSEPSLTEEDRSSFELGGTSSADELAAVLGKEPSDPLAESPSTSSSATAAAAASLAEEMSFLKPNMPSFVTQLPGDSALGQQQPYQSFQDLQHDPRSTSRFTVFDGEECAVVLIQRPRLNVTLSPLGRHVSISSFARGGNGEAGEIEESGKVFVGDIIVGVNGMRLNPELSPTAVGRLLVSLMRPFEIYFKRVSWEALEGGPMN